MTGEAEGLIDNIQDVKKHLDDAIGFIKQNNKKDAIESFKKSEALFMTIKKCLELPQVK